MLKRSIPLLVLLLHVCTSCASSVLAERGSYLTAYHAGGLVQAEERLDALAHQHMPKGNYVKSKEASWLLLDRATLRFARGKVEEAIQDYELALEALDYYDQDSSSDQLAQMLLQDETGAYQADDFEHVLARIYFALALLHVGDESNAFALLRQAEEFQQERQALYSKIPFTRHYRVSPNPLSKYLFAALLEKRGDFSNARILYTQTGLLPQEAVEGATIILICHNGNAPYKVSTTCPASVASTVALEILLASHGIEPAVSSFSGIPVPALRHWPFSNPVSIYGYLDGQNHPLMPIYSVSQAAAEELEQKRPVIAARGVARLAMRRCAVGYFQKKDPALGALADLTMFVVNDHTRADTRSWTTLPAEFDLVRIPVSPCEHALTIQAGHLLSQTYQLKLKQNDLCIVHVFNIHPGIVRILIPDRYLAIQGDSL
jgi:uncharacterized protein